MSIQMRTIEEGIERTAWKDSRWIFFREVGSFLFARVKMPIHGVRFGVYYGTKYMGWRTTQHEAEEYAKDIINERKKP